MFRTFSGLPKTCCRSAILVHKSDEMLARHASHGLRILVSCAPKLRSRYPSIKLPWLCEGQCMQLTLAGMFRRSKIPSALAVSEYPRRMHWPVVVMSHHRRERPSQTCGNDTVAEFLMISSSNVSPTRVPFTRWLHVACVCIGATRGPHDCVSRGMADQPSSQPVLFLRKIRSGLWPLTWPEFFFRGL